MQFEELLRFIERDMRMSHVYQPVMILALLEAQGRANREQIARALLNEDRSQLEYYAEIARDMPGRVLANRGVVSRNGRDYQLLGYDQFSETEIQELKAACQNRLMDYIRRRGEAIWEHRRASAGYVSGTLRYEVLKRAKFRCELCGISADERALEVDHITPRIKGGTDEIANLQALCYSCNAMKRDRDDTDFRAVRSSYEMKHSGCPFCAPTRPIIAENALAVLIEDAYPVTSKHLLVIPKRHVGDYFDLGTAEVRACHDLLEKGRALAVSSDPSVQGFNVGVNSGVVAGQTVMHAHIHLIPRREGDIENPRGGVRAVIPGKADYRE
jgi:ATP adenylyltransferase